VVLNHDVLRNTVAAGNAIPKKACYCRPMAAAMIGWRVEAHISPSQELYMMPQARSPTLYFDMRRMLKVAFSCYAKLWLTMVCLTYRQGVTFSLDNNMPLIWRADFLRSGGAEMGKLRSG